MAKRKQSHARIFWRDRSDGPRRAWGDFREYAGQGGKREPLVAPGESRATMDPVIAQTLFAARLAELAAAGENDTRAEPIRKKPTIAEVVKEHLAACEREQGVTPTWIESTGVFLGRAVTFFGAERRLGAITPEHVVEWIEWLRQVETVRGTTMSEGTVRHHLCAFSKLYRRAQRRRHVAPQYNPVTLLDAREKPRVPRSSTRCLEVSEAALLLEAARTYPVKKHEPEMALAYPLLAAFLLTGGRLKEVLGLRLEDVSTDRKTVAFRPNEFHKGHRLKTRGSTRTIPLWPQLAEILAPLLDQRAIEGGRLLFRSPHITDREAPLSDLRDLMRRLSIRAGFLRPVSDPATGKQRRTEAGDVVWDGECIQTRMFRVTYATARLQTLDHGAPVAPWTVEKELGHASREMLEEVYGRLGQVRHRSEAIEFRMEQHYDWDGRAWVPKKQSAPKPRTIAPAA